jgi:hypothetical protein
MDLESEDSMGDTVKIFNPEWAGLDKKLDELLTKQQESKRWQVTLAIITAIIGFSIWYAEHQIEKNIDKAKTELTTRLAITQQFYARKLATYEEVHRQMASLVSALADAQFNTAAKTTAVDNLHKLYLAYTQNSLYLSDQLVIRLKHLVDIGNQLPSLYPQGKTTMHDINNQVASIEDQMKNDLHTEELGRIPGLKEK